MMSEEKTPDDLDLDLTPEEEEEFLNQALKNLMEFIEDETNLGLWQEGEWQAIPEDSCHLDFEQQQKQEP
jgi:hypothetical protein